MLISDFPFVRSVHLLGKRLFGALFPPYGWMAMDGERDSFLWKSRAHAARTTFSAAKFHEDRATDRPTNRGDERRETRVNVLPIGYRRKSRKSGLRMRFPQVFRLSSRTRVYFYRLHQNYIRSRRWQTFLRPFFRGLDTLYYFANWKSLILLFILHFWFTLHFCIRIFKSVFITDSCKITDNYNLYNTPQLFTIAYISQSNNSILQSNNWVSIVRTPFDLPLFDPSGGHYIGFTWRSWYLFGV